MPFPKTQAIMAERRAKAEELAAKRAERTPAQQLALLDKKLGKDQGAVRERTRLRAVMGTA